MSESSIVEVPLTEARVCLYDAITGYAYVKSDFKTPLCGTTDSSGVYQIDYSHLVVVADISMIRARASKSLAGSSNSAISLSESNATQLVMHGIDLSETLEDEGSTRILNVNLDTTTEAMTFDVALAQISASNLAKVSEGAKDKVSDITAVLKDTYTKQVHANLITVESKDLVYPLGLSTEQQQLEEQTRAVTLGGDNTLLSSEQEATLTPLLNNIYKDSSNFQKNVELDFGLNESCTGEKCDNFETYLPKSFGDGLNVTIGKGANVSKVTQWADGTTFDHGADMSGMAISCTNCNYGEVTGFVFATHVDGRMHITEGFQDEYFGTELAGQHEHVYFNEIFDIPDAYIAGYDGGCLNEETFSKQYVFAGEFDTKDLDHLGEQLCDGTYIDEDRLSEGVNYEGWDHYDPNYKGYAGDCSDHIDESGNIKEYAPGHCHEQFGDSTWDGSEHISIDPFIHCYDEDANGDITIRTDFVASEFKTECDNFIQAFKGFTGSTTGIPDPTVESHVDYFCDAYFMIDENGKEFYRTGAPLECYQVYSGVETYDIDRDSICRNPDGSFKPVSEHIDGYHQDICSAYQFDKEEGFLDYYTSTNSGVAGAEINFETVNWEDFDNQDECSEESCENSVVYGQSCIKYSATNTPPCCYEKFPLEATVAFPICEGYDNYMPDPIASCYSGAISNGATLDTTNEDCYGFPKTIDTSNRIILAEVCHSYYNYDEGQTFNANTPAACTESVKTLIKCGEDDSGTLAAGCDETEVTCYNSIDVNWDSGNLEFDPLSTSPSSVTQASCETALGATLDSVDLYMPDSTSN